jgi:hypothetical protein
MYLAELHGKLSSDEEKKEDILTSNVFSFFKYSSRDMFLKEYLKELGLLVSNQEAKKAEFLFWPKYDDRTEPDLVLIVGKYYLLFEAKYHSWFGEETVTKEGQLKREIKGGELEAKNYQKEFILFAITADYYKNEKIKSILEKYDGKLKWTNWQTVSRFLKEKIHEKPDIKNEEIDFANDLYTLLVKKKLRYYHGIKYKEFQFENFNYHNEIFFDKKTVNFKRSFMGFLETLSPIKSIEPFEKIIFLNYEALNCFKEKNKK